MRRWLLALVLMVSGPLVAAPDMDRVAELAGQYWQVETPARLPGARAEMARPVDQGWMLTSVAVFSGQAWQIIALRLHPAGAFDDEARLWEQPLAELMARWQREDRPPQPIPELLEVDPPDYLPILPDETRLRRFSFDGYHHALRWRNTGGFDGDAAWQLTDYVILADPVND